MSELELGKGQMKVMRVLWKKKRATAQEITDILNESEPTKHSTVQTFLRILVKKGAAAYDVDKRTHIFYPLVEETQIKKYALQDFIDHVFAGSAGVMVSYLVQNQYITSSELKKIYKLFDEKKE